MRAYAVSYAESAGIAVTSSTPGAAPEYENETVVCPAGMVADAGNLTAAPDVASATVGGAGGGVETARVAIADAPATTPAAGESESFNERRRVASAVARPADAFAKKGSNCCRYSSICSSVDADGLAPGDVSRMKPKR